MTEIKGKVNTAVCYAAVVEDEAIEQIRRMCDHDFTAGSRIRIMPDVHAGRGCTIGTTMTITDKAVPNIVGVDIGCGMYTVELGRVDIDFERMDAAAHGIPCGKEVWEGRMERFDLTDLRCYRSLKQTKRLERSLGTLGGGNHFIEIDAAADGTKYLVIHSGSRNLGKQVAELYQNLAIDLNVGKDDYFRQRDQLIRTYKEQGRRSEIQTAARDRDHYLAPHHLPFQVGVGIVLITVMAVLVMRLFRSELFKPGFKIGMQAGFVIVDEHRCRDMHRVAQQQSLADAGFGQGGLDFRRDIHKLAAVRQIEDKFLAK